ncbi:MAG: hypothetical protein EBT12_02715 [Marivivens sp.]|nr:hypothetical protein [Marivivens sp.]
MLPISDWVSRRNGTSEPTASKIVLRLSVRLVSCEPALLHCIQCPGPGQLVVWEDQGGFGVVATAVDGYAAEAVRHKGVLVALEGGRGLDEEVLEVEAGGCFLVLEA